MFYLSANEPKQEQASQSIEPTFDQKRSVFEAANQIRSTVLCRRQQTVGGYESFQKNNKYSRPEIRTIETVRPFTAQELPAHVKHVGNIETAIPKPVRQPPAPGPLAPRYTPVVERPFGSLVTAPCLPGTDYRVVPLHEERHVGRITDFLPEIERDGPVKKVSSQHERIDDSVSKNDDATSG